MFQTDDAWRCDCHALIMKVAQEVSETLLCHQCVGIAECHEWSCYV
jgi:hypothetical protein